ncbi:hypothetical protein GCM10007103_14800 [Salinimicrobium marinum]|uniref:histidine kinase n=1 Tax=Salinimicrobium marinum TaxID=680283 RepID=A0A918SBM7_9FLAO|nr:PAS domain S-box protein [Salinimicrobium marinum]GHA34414.1 hypothetical protein GCM10007103_14800 [Salinimicrobium marinum]
MSDKNMPSNETNASGFSKVEIFPGKVAQLSPNLLFVIGLQELKIHYVNIKAEEFLENLSEDIFREGADIFKKLVHSNDYELFEQSLEEGSLLLDHEEKELDLRLKVEEGLWEWYRITYKAYEKNQAGAVSHLIVTAQNVHEQKVREVQLQEEDRRLKNAQAIGHIGSFERKLPGNNFIYSEEFYRILGLEPKQEEIGMDEFLSHVHPEDREAYKNAIDHTHATGEPLDMVTRINRADGTTRHVHRRAAIIYDEKGKPVRVYGTVQDITERLKAEEERNKFNKLLRATETIAETGSYEADLQSNNIFFSAGLFRLFGEEPDSFVPSQEWLEEHSHPEDVPIVREILEKARTSKKGYQYTRRIFHKSGEMRILEANGSVVTDAEGNVVKLIGLVQDVTARKQAEEELRRSEERSKNLLKVLQNAPDSYLVLTPDLHIEMASDAYLEATFTSRERIIGKHMFETFPDNPSAPEANSVNNLTASLKSVLSSKKPHRMNIQHYDVRRPDGTFEEKYWSPINTPVINSEGEVEYIIHRVLDVTDVMKKKTTDKHVVNETEMLKNSLEEIKLQADQIKESRALLQSVFDASPNSIILYRALYDEKGTIEDFEFSMLNAFTFKLLKVSRDIIGKRLLHEFPNSKETGLFERFKRTVETGEPTDVEIWYEGDGLQHWFHFRANRINELLVVTTEDITERKKAEQELILLKDELAQRANDKYRKIINSMDEGYCLLDIIFDDNEECIDYRFVDTNPVFEKQSGLKNVLGKRLNELAPESPDFWKKIYGKVALTGASIRLEDYSEVLERWFDVYAFPIDAANRKQVAVIFKDTTKRKEAEERQSFLLRLNDALQQLAEPEEIQEKAMEILGEHLEVNRAYYSSVSSDGDRMLKGFGYQNNISGLPEERSVSDFGTAFKKLLLAGEIVVNNNLRQDLGLNERVKESFRNLQVEGFIGVPLLRNGNLVTVIEIHDSDPRRWTLDEIALIKEVSDKAREAVERAEIEKALRESEQRFRNLVEASALAVWETAPNGEVLQDSLSWRSFTGQTFEEFYGKGWLQAVHKEDREYAASQWNEAVASRTKVDAEFRLKNAAGGYKWTNVRAIPILDVSGRVIKWSGMNLDIHHRKMTEEALRNAKEEAEAASRAKEDFVSTISHEIRTPLNAVIGITNLLLEQNPRDDQKDNLGSLSFSAKNLLALINDILDFSKLEAGKMELAENAFNLHDLLFSLKNSHEPQALANDTSLLLNLDETIPERITTDQLKLSQILHNLVSNAVKFTQKGRVVIEVNLSEREEDVLWLDFAIQDSGIGVPEDKVDHIFDKFAQAESTTVRHYGGTGLGLSITKLLLELMGSEIKVESKVGEGSVFYFNLPVKIAYDEIPFEELMEIPEDLSHFNQMNLLLVEDVEINRKILVQFLQNWWQLEPDYATNGKQALEMAKRKVYDLILMDVRMPVMDGYEATRQIRKLSGYKNTPILALTADKNQEVQQAQHATQFSDLLTKPFEPADLKKRIIKHLSGSGKNFTAAEKEVGAGNPEPVEQKDSNKPEAPVQFGSEKAFEISRYKKIAGDNAEILHKLIGNVIRAFELYRKEFLEAANDESEEDLSNLVHKNTTSVHYIQANRLAETIGEFREFLSRPTPEIEALEAKKAEILQEFDLILAGLKVIHEKEE